MFSQTLSFNKEGGLLSLIIFILVATLQCFFFLIFASVNNVQLPEVAYSFHFWLLLNLYFPNETVKNKASLPGSL